MAVEVEMDREEVNETLRNSFNNILNREPTEREKELKEVARKEKEEYEEKKKKFYNNPLHWDNNKRRRYGLPVLRGKVNKCRVKRYPAFHPTPYLFYIIQDVIDENICEILDNGFFNEFVEFKNINKR